MSEVVEVLATLRDVLLVGTVASAAVWDVRARRIPNLLVVSALAVALAMHALEGGSAFLGSAAGAGVALVAGFALFASGLIGAGDAKLLCAAAAFLGLRTVPAFFGFAALAGGALALGSAVRQRILFSTLRDSGRLTAHLLSFGLVAAPPTPEQGRRLTLPYAVAIAAGAVAARFV